VVEQLAGAFGQNPYSFIYQRMSLGNYSGVELSRRHRVPLVLEYNGSEAWVANNWGQPLRFHGLACRTEEVCLRHAHAVVTISEVLQEELLERGVEPERIAMYPNCIDPRTFDPDRLPAEAMEVRERHGLARDNIVVGFIGTFGPWHGVDVLAQAIRSLVESESEWLRRHKVHFLIVGDGAKMPVVRQVLEGSGWQEFCTLTGVVPQAQAPEYLAAADVLLSPHVANADGTRFFGSPTKLFEYMAMGKAIVASDLDQIGKVLERSLRAGQLPAEEPAGTEDRLSVLAQPGDVESLLAGIRFCVMRPRWREVLGRNARAEALAKYTWSHHVGAIRSRLSRLGVVSEA
jgi:glycosyltransferase involved in cell wall biosynthesis